jgi:hypothetical protein
MGSPPLKLNGSVCPTRDIQVLFRPDLPCRRVLKGPGHEMRRSQPRSGELIALLWLLIVIAQAIINL